MRLTYDVITIGAGHAGCEAAAIASLMGAKVLLVTFDLARMGQMSCNPAVGGVGKGQIVREIDALGGLSALVTDESSIQFRMLNESKGPAMWSPRSQCDRFIFSQAWRRRLEAMPNLSLLQDSVTELLLTEGAVSGVRTLTGMVFTAPAVILTAGTFLSGLMHVGESMFPGGRIGEPSSEGITDQLRSWGIQSGRLKTGTPVRIDGRSVDYTRLQEQLGDTPPQSFSFIGPPSPLPQRSCFIAHTNPATHRLLEEGFDRSPLFKGIIQGIGPRYCPSIEDKVRTFSHRTSHQLFLEPEGLDTYEMYLNGFSSSLPAEVQLQALLRVEGFERVHILRPGYAIEYDFFPPTQLHHTLESKIIPGLYFAGQVNGTTGYEEAAAQGLMAGINAVLRLRGADPFVLLRDQAYIGVLIDDLVTKGVDEPYRMFTSRAEHRILLRHDNADERLTPLAASLGTASAQRVNALAAKTQLVSQILGYLSSTSVQPATINPFLLLAGTAPLSQPRRAVDLALRPQVRLEPLLRALSAPDHLHLFSTPQSQQAIQSAEVSIKYRGYIDRERELADRIVRLDHIRIPPTFDFSTLPSMSTEAREKLVRVQPTSVGQARRIPGVSPSDVSVLLVALGR